MSAISAVIVSYDDTPQQIRTVIDGLLAQSHTPSEILLIDNSPQGALAEGLHGYTPSLHVIAPRSNLGYVGAVNLAATSASGKYLLCLNPDAQAMSDCIEHLAMVADNDPSIALVGAQILLPDGVTRNAGANPLHPSGISPSGGFGEHREHGEPREVAVVSGACCLIRREAFLELGGFVEEFFLYYDDVDLAWRARIAGMRVVYCPEAVVTHDYDFDRRPRKWFYLERNRLFSVLANYEARTLLLLSPLLLATEFGLLAVATYGGWLSHKLEGYRSLIALRTQLTEQRRAVKAIRRCRDIEVLERFENHMDSALLPPPGPALANAIWTPYMRLVTHLLAAIGPRTRSQG